MSQNTELAKVKARIRALAARTVERGCTEAEAAAAMERVGKLLRAYSLNMDEVDLREERCARVRVAAGGRRRGPLDSCVVPIARFCECRTWLDRTEAGVEYSFLGLGPDAAMAEYLFRVVRAALASETAAFKAASGLGGAALRLAGGSFAEGMARRVAARLGEMAASRARGRDPVRDPGRAAAGGGGALVVIKQEAVERAMREMGLRLRAVARRRGAVHDVDAYRRGAEAGGRVDLGRPIESGRRAAIGA